MHGKIMVYHGRGPESRFRVVERIITLLTLLVVPTLYSLFSAFGEATEKRIFMLRRAYWAFLYRLTGAGPEEEKPV